MWWCGRPPRPDGSITASRSSQCERFELRRFGIVRRQRIDRFGDNLLPAGVICAPNDDGHIAALFWRTWRWTFGLSALGAIAYGLLGRTVVELWLGKAALPDIPYAFWLAGIALFFLSATRPAAIYAYATARFRQLLPVAGLELSIKLLVLYWMFPKVGILAPMVGLITAHVVGVFFLYWRLAPRPVRS